MCTMAGESPNPKWGRLEQGKSLQCSKKQNKTLQFLFIYPLFILSSWLKVAVSFAPQQVFSGFYYCKLEFADVVVYICGSPSLDM